MANPSFLTLLLAIAVAQVFLCTAPGAHALQGMNLAAPVVRRAEHVQLNERMLKKRRPQTPADVGNDVPINAGGDVPPSPTITTTASTTTQSTSSTRPTTSIPQTTSTPPNVINTLTALANPTTTTTSHSTTTTSTSSTVQTTTAQTSSTTAPATLSRSTISSVPFTTNRTGGTVYVTASANDAAQTTDVAQDPSASFLPRSVIIGLIVTGSCIAAGAAIWTIIRKWKFSPSRQFEDRLEPINWEPTQDSGLGHDPTVAALARAGSTRPTSYMSESHEGSVQNMSSVHPEPISMAPDFPPAHDFTAGAAGTGGYVDMHRGPSPAPGQYNSAYGGQYETPNPYDAYDYNNTGGYGQRHY